MFCGECGTDNPDTNSFCKNCGKALRKPQPAVAGAQFPLTPVTVPAIPVYPPQAVAPAPPSVEAPLKPARNWLAIIGAIVSLAAWLVYPIILGFVAIALGAAAIYTAKKNHAKIPVSAIAAIIIGLLAIVINFFWLDLFPAPVVLPPVK